jgi:tetratricopeptide (TPR) repeat protein
MTVGGSDTVDTQVGDPTSGEAGALGVDDLRRGARLGRYVVEDRLGAGGMGVVYVAHDPQLDRRVALKVLAPRVGLGSAAGSAGHARLLREAQALARLSHPNVVAVHDIGVVGDRVFVAMELIEGTTLARWLADRPRTPPEILAVLAQAGRGLQAAHEAGLVHRDFKPENVMVDPHGRARVLDFGLARASGGTDILDTEADDAPALDAGSSSELTVPGAVMGTPAYMSPEQHIGRRADAKSDQFSFCVVAYEALFGQRPFAASSLPELVTNVIEGRVRPIPTTVRVVPRAREAILRGLSVAPDARHPSMRTLLAAIEPEHGRTVRAVAIGGVAIGVVGLAVAVTVGLGGLGGSALSPCAGGDPMAEVWNAERRGQVERAFEATGKPYAARAHELVTATLASYGEEWRAAHLDACEATRVRQEQSDALMDRRMACLQRAREEVDALVRLLVEADAEIVARAGVAVAALPSPAACSAARVVERGSAAPDDPELRMAVEALRPRVARLFALHRAGRYELGITEATEVVAQAERLGWRPLEAEARLAAGRLLVGGGKAEAAEAELEKAARAGEAGAIPELVAAARVELVSTVGERLGRFDDGLEWAQNADAALEGIDAPDPELVAALAYARGGILVAQGKQVEALEQLELGLKLLREQDPARRDGAVARMLAQTGNALADRGRNAEALERLEESLAIHESLLGPRHPTVAEGLANRAGVFWAENRLDAAAADMERALDIAMSSMGAEHPTVAAFLNNLGVVYEHSGRLEDAARVYRQALTSLESTAGENHPNVPNAVTNLGNVLREQGDLAGAQVQHERARELWRKSIGIEHFKYANALVNLGSTYRALDRLDDALACYEEALAIRRRVFAGQHTDIGQALENIADVHHLRGALDRAGRLYAEALAMRIAATGDRHEDTTFARIGLGRVRTEQRRLAQAVTLLEEALAIRERGEGGPGHLAWPRFYLAKARWARDAPGDRESARTLAAQAVAELETPTSPTAVQRAELDEVRAWAANPS